MNRNCNSSHTESGSDHFPQLGFEGGKLYWTPCSPGADGAVAMKLMDVLSSVGPMAPQVTIVLSDHFRKDHDGKLKQ